MELEEAIKIYDEIRQKQYEKFERTGETNIKIGINTIRAVDRMLKYIKEESIPRAVVEEKIEEVTSNIPYLATFNDWKQEQHTNAEIIENCIDILQEILTKGEK